MPAFGKEDRVNIPGLASTQGVIRDLSETVPGFPVYAIVWLTEFGETRTGTVGEGDLRRVNPTADDQTAANLESVNLERRTEADVNARVEARLKDIAAGKRKRKPAAKRRR